MNAYRKGKTYLDVEAAEHVYGKADKNKLTQPPFVRMLDYGKKIDCYWNYHHMIVQFDDIFVLLNVLL